MNYTKLPLVLLFLSVTIFTGTVSYAAGGPDAYGYTWMDGNDPGGPIFNWVEIMNTGTMISGFSDDDYLGPFPIGFTFPFYDGAYDAFYISANGFISFGSGYTIETYDPCTIPGPADPNNCIALCWDDWFPTESAAYYEYFDAHPVFGECLVIEVYDWPWFYASSNYHLTAEVILFPDGGMHLQYLDTPDTGVLGQDIGIENSTGTIGLSYSCFIEIPENFAIRFEVTPALYMTGSELIGPRTELIHDITLTNFSGQSDTFSLTAETPIWPTEFRYNGDPVTSIGPVPDKEVVTFQVAVQIPYTGATCPDTDAITIEARSVTYPEDFFVTSDIDTRAYHFTGDWYQMSPAPVNLVQPVMCEVNDFIYVLGGDNDIQAQKYDITTDTWSVIPVEKPTRSYSLTGVVIGTEVFVPGGGDYCGFVYQFPCGHDQFEVFDTVTETWYVIDSDPLPGARAAGAAVLYDGKIYFFGGFGANTGDARAECWMYDPDAPAGNRWNDRASMNYPRFHHDGVVFRDKIYAIGGRLELEPVYEIEEYDPVADTWTHVDTLPETDLDLSTRAVTVDGSTYREDDWIIIMIGSTFTGDENYGNFAYNPFTHSLLEYPPLLDARQGFSLCRAGDKMVVSQGNKTTTEVIDCTLAATGCIHHGDVNEDCELTSQDAQLAFLIALGVFPPSFSEACGADCNGNGDVSAGDAQQIFFSVLGLGTCVDPINM